MPLDMVKLKKLILVMLSADQAGEIAAASAAITKALKGDGKDIHWLADKLVSAAPPPPPPPRQPPPPPPPYWASVVNDDWVEDLAFCLAHISALRPREQEFIRSLSSQNATYSDWEPTEKQEAWLTSIAERLRRYYG